MSPLPAVSLFSNCGAGDIGYSQTGFAFEVMAELDERRLSVALLNHPTARGVPGDLRETLPAVVGAYKKARGKERPALLAACPPCQGMSSAAAARGSGSDPEVGSQDDRNLLVAVIADAVEKLKPRSVVVENVPAFLTRAVRDPRTGDTMSAARLLGERLSATYVAYPLLADLADFGVPQTRRRAFLTFLRKGEPAVDLLDARAAAPYPRPTHSADYGSEPLTLRDALAEAAMGPLDASSTERARSTNNPMHFVPVWEPERYAMVAAIPPGSGGTAWETDECSGCGAVTSDAGAATCPRCGEPLLRPLVRGEQGIRLITGFRSSSYGRMHPDRPASTITSASGHVGSDRTIHPWENRVLSPAECAILQTLPPSFKWGDALERWGHSNVRKMIGEAVPPRFTQAHGRILSSLLDERRPPALISAFDIRCTRARQKLMMTE